MDVKALLRPLVFRARLLRGKLSRIVRPWAEWDGRHHPVLARFPAWSGESDGTWVYDSLGVRTDPRFRFQFRPQPAGRVETSHPAPHAQYFELVFVLDAIASASKARPFVMVELGAGYGTWLATVARAAETAGLPGVRLTGVEMIPQYFGWMKEHLANNGVNPAAHDLRHAAVSDVDGEAVFREPTDPGEAFGVSIRARGASTAAGAGPGSVTVPCLSLPTILEGKESIDLIHCDTQGEEARIFSSCMDLVADRVSHLLVSTHGNGIHRQLRDSMRAAGFEIRYDFGVRKRERTEYGDVQFLDGLLCAVNPRRAAGPPAAG